jgi:hypothetical protein
MAFVNGSPRRAGAATAVFDSDGCSSDVGHHRQWVVGSRYHIMKDKLSAGEINLSPEIDRERNSRQLVRSKSIMKSSFNYTAVKNEINHPYVVEVAVVSDGLNIELCRRIMQFHKSRRVELRYGRRLTRRGGKIHYGWCFADLLIARAFAEQFGGEFRKRTPFQNRQNATVPSRRQRRVALT